VAHALQRCDSCLVFRSGFSRRGQAVAQEAVFSSQLDYGIPPSIPAVFGL